MTGPASVLHLLELDADGRITSRSPADPAGPVLNASDLAATRGDGVFETISVAEGHPQALAAHLDRLASSARMLDLPPVDVAGWRQAVAAVAAELAPHPEAWVKIVLSRGVEGGDRPSGWAWGDVSPDHRRARTAGISVTVLDRGLSSTASASPWLLAGAKTLSYGVNMAARREADRRGVDDVIFVSSDGVLLEGPTATLVLRIDGRLVTPEPSLGVLPGTSQADLFAWAGSRGLPTEFARLERSALDEADAAWLVSSVRHAAPIREIDGRAIAVDHATTDAVNAMLLARRD